MGSTGQRDVPGVARRAGALAVYRQRFREGRTYSLPAYALGSLLHHRFSSAGAVARLRGRPAPVIEAGEGEIHVGHVGLYPGVQLRCAPGASIRIGDGTYLNRNTLIYAEQEVSIGERVMIAWNVIITDTPGFGERPGLTESQSVHIGDGAWIGAKAVIVAGARVGAHAVVAAGAVVDGVVEEGAIVAVRPARQLGVLPGGEDV
jgi:acetyltransferase-like isoleucine patch superfamily enzyme